MPDQIVTVISRKYDLRIRRSWKCRLVGRDNSLLTFVGEFDADYEHADLGLIRSGTLSFEYYWLDRWYNIFRFHEPDGSLRNYYCNVNMPPKFAGDVLDYVDLDIDIVVWPDLRTEILDRDEFEENAARYNYPKDVISKTSESVEDLLRMIAHREFPFAESFGTSG